MFQETNIQDSVHAKNSWLPKSVNYFRKKHSILYIRLIPATALYLSFPHPGAHEETLNETDMLQVSLT